jgi:hypothetical protein
MAKRGLGQVAETSSLFEYASELSMVTGCDTGVMVGHKRGGVGEEEVERLDCGGQRIFYGGSRSREYQMGIAWVACLARSASTNQQNRFTVTAVRPTHNFVPFPPLRS